MSCLGRKYFRLRVPSLCADDDVVAMALISGAMPGRPGRRRRSTGAGSNSTGFWLARVSSVAECPLDTRFQPVQPERGPAQPDSEHQLEIGVASAHRP